MREPKEVVRIFEQYTALVEQEIRRVLDGRPRLCMYDMMRYFFGFTDERGNPISVYGGKRFRSGLCLLLVDLFGKMDQQAVRIAAAIEVFHNFTLIHDDIEDHDEFRRGRPTVWNVWGVNHAINAGDGQLILAHILLGNVSAKQAKGASVQRYLEEKFLEVIEGQFLDFTITETRISDTMATEELYMDMVAKKTCALVGAACVSAGMLADLASETLDALFAYGFELGFAYQICDDMVSVWGDPRITGKTAHNDIREQKKTLPFLFLKKTLSGGARDEFFTLYQKDGALSEEEIQKILQLLNESGAYDHSWKEVQRHAEAAKRACNLIPISEEGKSILKQIVDALLPNIRQV